MIVRSPPGAVTIRQPGRWMPLFMCLCFSMILWGPAAVVAVWLAVDYSPTGLGPLMVLAVAATWISGRTARISVRFDDDGITVRNFWRTHRLSWDQVTQFADGGGADLWKLRLLCREGRAVDTTGTTTDRSVAKSAVLTVIGQVAERYGVGIALTGAHPAVSRRRHARA
jgi:hypothetical protein